MSKKSYAAKFKDPRWQKKRLEVLQQYGFSCQECGAEEQELHVHHKRYYAGREPWEYKDTEMMVLCNDCHQQLHDAKENLLTEIGELSSAENINRVAGYVAAVNPDAFACQIDTPDKEVGYSDFYRITQQAVMWLIKNNNGRMPISQRIPLDFGIVEPE